MAVEFDWPKKWWVTVLTRIVSGSIPWVALMIVITSLLVSSQYEDDQCTVGWYNKSDTKRIYIVWFTATALGCQALAYSFKVVRIKWADWDVNEATSTNLMNWFVSFRDMIISTPQGFFSTTGMGFLFAAIYLSFVVVLTGDCMGTTQASLVGVVRDSYLVVGFTVAFFVLAGVRFTGLIGLDTPTGIGEFVVIFRNPTVFTLGRLAAEVAFFVCFWGMYSDGEDHFVQTYLQKQALIAPGCTVATANNATATREYRQFKAIAITTDTRTVYGDITTDLNQTLSRAVLSAVFISCILLAVRIWDMIMPYRGVTDNSEMLKRWIRWGSALCELFVGCMMAVLAASLIGSNAVAGCPTLDAKNGWVVQIYTTFIWSVLLVLVDWYFETMKVEFQATGDYRALGITWWS